MHEPRIRMNARPPYRAAHAACVCVLVSLGGCGFAPPSQADGDVFVSIINVTPFVAVVTVSGIRDGLFDAVERTVQPSDSADITFTCIDELVLGDPSDPDKPGAEIDPSGLAATIQPTSIFLDESFLCGDFVEFVISGTSAETLAVHIFAYTPP